jgi:membrane protein involved in colicin uptake
MIRFVQGRSSPRRRISDAKTSRSQYRRLFSKESLAAKAESKHLMTKRQLIEEISKLNTTAQPHFLAQFDEPDLKQYLEHLEGAVQKHLRINTYVKASPKLRMVS